MSVTPLVAAPIQAPRAESLTADEQKKRDAVEHYMRARLHAGESEFEEALKEFRKAVELEPNDGSLRREYADMLRGLPVLDQAEELYRTVASQDPDNRGALVALLRVYERQRKYDKAVPIVEGFVKGQPQNLSLKAEYGALLVRARRFDDASRVLQEVLKAE